MTADLVSPPFHTAPGEGIAVWQLGSLLTFKATSQATGGRGWAKELLAPHGMASPRHVHTHEDEAFYVLEGEVSIYVGDDVVRASPGSFLWGPRTVPHAFCVESETAKMLVFATTASFDRFFLDTGTPASSRTLPTQNTGAPDLDAIAAAAHQYGVDIVGPPPAPSTR